MPRDPQRPQLHVHLTPALTDELAAVAEAEGVSLPEIARRCIIAALPHQQARAGIVPSTPRTEFAR